MTEQRIDESLSHERWEATAKLWDRITADGGDYHRCEFFGPAFLAECGDVRGLRTLDVGCGSGWFSRELARAGADVTGIDWSAKMIDCAKAREADQPLGIGYHPIDARRLDEHFDREPVADDRAIARYPNLAETRLLPVVLIIEATRAQTRTRDHSPR
jgi:2-polyprenyl-3-methyl-5-hydroxy-6-metoxy-1,4-benzoquinol methylase